MKNPEGQVSISEFNEPNENTKIKEISTEQITNGSVIEVITSSGSSYQISKIDNELYLLGGKLKTPTKIERLGARAESSMILNANTIITGHRLECGGKEIPAGVVTTSVIKEIKIIS